MSRSRVTRTSAELALVGVSLANVIGFIRVFADFTFLPVLATTVVAAHLLAVGCRRLGWGTIVSCVVSAGGLAIAAPLLLVRDTTWYGLPTHLSWTTIRLELVDAWNQFSTVKAPVPGEAGFLAAALIAVWVAAWLADTFAFRFDALIEAIVPTAGVFLFVSVLARPDYRLVSCALYLLAVFAFVAMHRAWLDERAPGWLADSSSSIAPTVLRTTLKVGAVAVVAALVLGPALPGRRRGATLGPRHEQWGRHPRDAEPARRHPRPARRSDEPGRVPGDEPDALLLAAHGARHVRRQDLVVGVEVHGRVG